jgi:prophage DNA circulation protein
MEQDIAITEKSVELTEVIAATVEEAAPVTEVIATIVEEAAPVTEVIINTVEEVNTVAEVIATIVEEAAPVTELIINTVEEVNTVAEVIANTVEEANSLTATQKEALDIVFNDVKGTVEHILIDADVPIQIKLMQMISPIIKTVQDVSALKLALTGADKKAIVLDCGRKCIRMMLKDHQDMLTLYDTIAEPALETMLDLSRNLKSVHDKLKDLEKKEPSQECCLEVVVACMGLKTK